MLFDNTKQLIIKYKNVINNKQTLVAAIYFSLSTNLKETTAVVIIKANKMGRYDENKMYKLFIHY